MAKPYERRTRFYPDPRRPFERMISLKTPIRPDQTEQYFESNLLWELVMGRAKYFYASDIAASACAWDKVYDDKAVKGISADDGPGLLIRGSDIGNCYNQRIYAGEVTADHHFRKRVAGAWTTIGSEAIDVDPHTVHLLKTSAKGSEFKCYREDMVTPKFTVTDTAFLSGYWGIFFPIFPDYTQTAILGLSQVILEEPSSPSSPKPIRYYECLVIGDGSDENPFRPELPEEIVDHPRFGKVNKLAFS